MPARRDILFVAQYHSPLNYLAASSAWNVVVARMVQPGPVNAQPGLHGLHGLHHDTKNPCQSLQGVRAASSDSSKGHAEGPPRERLKAIPFAISKQQADDSYKQFHSKQPFLAPLRQYEKAKEAFLPFWMMSGTVSVHVGSAQVGTKYTGNRLNPTTMRVEMQTYTSWQTVRLDRTWERLYRAEQEQLQLYAGSKYPQSDIQKLRPGPALVHAKALEGGMMADPSGRLRRVYPFTMTPDTAKSKALAWIEGQERDSVQALLLQEYPGADEISNIELNVTFLSDVSAHPVYIPVYVFTLRSPLFQFKMRTFVGAFPGAPVAGTRMYDDTKIASLAAVVTPIILIVAGFALPWLRLFWIGAVLPGVLAGFTARIFPELRAWWHGFLLPQQQKWQERSQREHDWDADWVREYKRDHSSSRGRSWQQQRGQTTGPRGSQAPPSSSLGDSKGYYRLLGVPQSASTSEIQAAFRAAALKYHPDTQASATGADRVQSTAMFQRVQEAYSTLRDTERRRQYDQMR